ncbi:hypothetical protein PPTG_22451 [Phytophthora nicotianae INRA-310]|uniref:Uncharacterized protein n=1 Tax=Phytophthora nicotianae (strain INRA-310) TaxID=761204 RepID=W2QIN3_PHYN3|nr:hypothetical protein PPTG_22451 [Phytophthora nicotianae INRA-310]ETN12120.1 hypothetical protein PPTG_22451 [Phytophthora nicotianae INRA-310]
MPMCTGRRMPGHAGESTAVSELLHQKGQQHCRDSGPVDDGQCMRSQLHVSHYELQVAAQPRSASEITIQCFSWCRADPKNQRPSSPTALRKRHRGPSCNASAFPAADADAAPKKQKSVINHRRGEAQVAPPGGCARVNVSNR